MYGHNYSSFPRAFDADFPEPQLMAFPFSPPQITVPDNLVAGAEFDTSVRDAVRAALTSSEQACCNSSSSASGCSSYGSPSYCTQRPPFLMQRSVSSHSLPKNGFHQLVSESGGPVRRVFSTGDLQRINGVQCYQRSESPLSNENSIIIESMTRATKYTPKEKKERIERYRSKRHHRNFNKKIKYACRKTLADSRPRIRGRFARNDEIDQTSSENQWSHFGAEEEDEYDDNWIHLLDAFSANLLP